MDTNQNGKVPMPSRLGATVVTRTFDVIRAEDARDLAAAPPSWSSSCLSWRTAPAARAN